MKIESQAKKLNHKADIIAGLLFFMFLLGGGVSQMSHPWTCEQAREAWHKTQLDDNSQYRRQLEPVMVNRDTIHLCK
jgi:hypothetical protein